mgnify:CR=1 FL=1
MSFALNDESILVWVAVFGELSSANLHNFLYVYTFVNVHKIV